MDVSELRKRILRAIDDARKDAALRRQSSDQAAEAYADFLSTIAAPLFVQAAIVLRAAGHEFTANTPAGSVRLTADRSADEFVELELDTSGTPPQVIGRTSVRRGRQGHLVEERPLAPGKSIRDLMDDVVVFVGDS
jgi:hypothetical protein